jgi:hypothetical protein
MSKIKIFGCKVSFEFELRTDFRDFFAALRFVFFLVIS